MDSDPHGARPAPVAFGSTLQGATEAGRAPMVCLGEAGRRRRRGVGPRMRRDQKNGQRQGTFGWGWQAKGNGANQLEFHLGLQNLFARSDFLPSATKWHRLQGCWPSKVFPMAVSKASVREKLMVMLTQARDCNRAQCPPTTQMSASTIVNLLRRFNTAGRLPKRRAPVNARRARIWC